ncbi:MAG: type I pullulanase [Erysipelotrichaceae bacterium]|nr:type I pullulanase [Erysipelotrichaceae bacterium]
MKKKLFLFMSLCIFSLCVSCNSNNNESSNESISNDETSITDSSNTPSILDTTYAYEIPSNPTVYVHYYNYAENYKDWLTWIWPHMPESGEGARFYFQSVEEILDRTWATLAIDTSSPMENVLSSWDNTVKTGTIAFSSSLTALGIIIRNKAGSKEYDGDRYIDLTKKSSDGKTHLYVIEGSSEMFYQLEDVSFNMVSSATLTSTTTIEATSFSKFSNFSNFKVTCDNEELKINKFTLDATKKKATITLEKPFDMSKLASKTYLEVDSMGQREVAYDALYTCKEFEDLFVTDETLGAIYSQKETTFKVWSPVASSITLNLYENGNTGSAYQKVELEKKDKGVFSCTVKGNLDKVYYTYDVVIGSKVNKDVVDPYAVSTGVNGLRGEILDMDALNPIGWDDVKIPTTTSQSQALVYELHTSDLTSDSSWNGNPLNAGKYLGLCEENTNITVDNVTYKTGFDYIKDLGISHVQLQPIYDFKSVDETRLNDANYVNTKYGGAYNWGYDPQNYNALEGSYSSNPYEGSVRVKEFKEVMKAYNNANIGVIMDVVFNHMPSSSETSFEKIFPGYYFRGRNDSGAGADTACERAMFKKYMKDVTVNWVKEYKLSGFRFDLMGLHTVEAMNEVKAAVDEAIHENNSETVSIIYGEAWSMYGGKEIGMMATQSSVNHLNEIGCFNDTLRSGARGSSTMGGDDATKGWLAGENVINTIYSVIEGLNKTYSRSFIGSSVNYVECHDNLTLYDKLSLSNPKASIEDIKEMDILGASLVYTSTGISFIQAGQEFLRSKEVESDDTSEKVLHCSVTNRAYNRDSYNAYAKLNSLKWNRMVEYIDVVNAYKQLILMRKEQKIFTPSSFDEVDKTVSNKSQYNVLEASLLTSNDKMNWKDVKIIYNNQPVSKEIEGYEGYHIGFINNTYTSNGALIENSLTIPSRQMVVLYK